MKWLPQLRGSGTVTPALTPCWMWISLDLKAPLCVLSLLEEKNYSAKGLGGFM